MIPRRYIVLTSFLVFIGVVLIISHGSDRISGRAPKVPKPNPKPCSQHLGWLEQYQFSSPIRYVSRDILTIPSTTNERPSLTVMEDHLFDDFTTIDLGKSFTAEIEKCLPPLRLEVPHNQAGPPDSSNLIFGLQTKLTRLKATVKHLERWLPHTKARLFAIVTNDDEQRADDGQIAALQKEFRDKGMDVTIIHPVRPEDSFAQRYFSLVSVMYQARNEKTQWTICIDDDTFFPSTHDLQALLSKFDTTKPQYVGSLSEDWWAVNHYGLMGFGGAGILLSLPLAQVIHEHNDDCKENLRTTAGDISVMDCVYRFTSTKLTHIPGLHQVDMHGDLSGFYESGREMTSLHHWKEGSAAGYKLEMEKMHLVADICDSCFLQRWQFPDEIVLSNGFSIAQYPQGHISGQSPKGVLGTSVGGAKVEKINLEQMEKTWGDDINVLHSLAPVRDKLGEDVKVAYKLLGSMVVDSDPDHLRDSVRQVYFREGGERNGGGKEMDTVMVLNWRKGEVLPEPSATPVPVRMRGRAW